MTFDIVLLALVAAFLGLRLYSVLGKRTGHEQEPALGTSEEASSHDTANHDTANDVISHPTATVTNLQAATNVPGVVEQDAEEGIRDIMNADRGFNLPQFGKGARSAYDMILNAFWTGNRQDLQNLCDADVFKDFDAAISAREAAEQIVENRLIRIDEARIVDAALDNSVARITVRFDADIAALTKDKDGNIVGGSLSDAIETHDIWTFERDIKNDNRNWTLTATDAV